MLFHKDVDNPTKMHLGWRGCTVPHRVPKPRSDPGAEPRINSTLTAMAPKQTKQRVCIVFLPNPIIYDLNISDKICIHKCS